MFSNPREQAQREYFRENVRRRSTMAPSGPLASTSTDTSLSSQATDSTSHNLTHHQEELLQKAMIALAQFVTSKESHPPTDGSRPVFEREGTTGSEMTTPMLDRQYSSATDLVMGIHGRESSMPLSISSGTLNEFRSSPSLRDFESTIDDLKSALNRFEHALRTVGSGGPAMHAAEVFRTSLRQMLSLFHKHHQLFTSVDDAGEKILRCSTP
ncbi:hypothetical protein SCHPADRAFT_577710 [Schizopora paradoxa]|uniref:Uncharacterized protein n=1 Tax=Schizopora paradoxa TaxID=27342 RepID=A0A0H2RB90_9AGAM|nr:hypothetical protein SCHPADRAFT_577710 [Schizopora paradoxa]